MAGAAITSGIWIFSTYFIITSILTGSKEFMNDTLLWRFIIGVFFYLLIVSLNYILIYYNSFQDKIVKEAELNSLIREAELKSLKYQINPHFIFNSLNSISALTLSQPAQAQAMTIKLSEFMRNTLSKNIKQKNQLSEELRNVRLYLDIEKIRFREKFDVIEEVSDECEKVEVPNMILQPLVENAIKHGVYESIDKVTIRIKCRQESDYLAIEVENNFDEDAISNRGEGLGLQNIRNRLKLIYNKDNLLSITKERNRFTAKIFIPLASKAA
jgi:LytS/YehU family sensor histidine kinase